MIYEDDADEVRGRKCCGTCKYGVIEPDGTCHYDCGGENWAGEISTFYVCDHYEELNPYEVLHDMWLK